MGSRLTSQKYPFGVVYFATSADDLNDVWAARNRLRLKLEIEARADPSLWAGFDCDLMVISAGERTPGLRYDSGIARKDYFFAVVVKERAQFHALQAIIVSWGEVCDIQYRWVANEADAKEY